jgi:hypothetical protein
MHWSLKVLFGIIIFVIFAFAIVGCNITVGRPAWNPGIWFEKSDVDNQIEGPVGNNQVSNDSVGNDSAVAEKVAPILPDMPGTDLHTYWESDINFVGWKGLVSFPHPLQDEMVASEHAFSLHQIDAEDENMIFVVTWGDDARNVEGAWYVNEYFVENFDWNENSPEDFYDRFVEEIEDWTVPNSVKEDTTIPSGTSLHIEIFFGTQAQKPYYEFEFTKP